MPTTNQTAYFGISKSNRINFDLEIEAIKNCLQAHHVDLKVFVDDHQFTAAQEKEMMQTAFADIDACDVLIVEVTKKAIGVGVEVGYAKAKNKPIVYLKRQGSKHSTTVGGTSDYHIEYHDVNHLYQELDKVMYWLIL